jgi:RES domain-containing protein
LEIAIGIYWRISNYIDLRGEGGRVASARWHTAGQRIIYLAESPAVAMFEALVHMDYEVQDLPDEFTLLKIGAPDSLKISLLDPSENPDWREQPEFTRGMGDAWLASRGTALARVPSAVVPHAWNYLLNPEHPDAKLVRIEGQSRERLDIRLSRRKLR